MKPTLTTGEPPLSDDLATAQAVLEGLVLALADTFPHQVQALALSLRAVAASERQGPTASRILAVLANQAAELAGARASDSTH